VRRGFAFSSGNLPISVSAFNCAGVSAKGSAKSGFMRINAVQYIAFVDKLDRATDRIRCS
jgi:hypothetical protein